MNEAYRSELAQYRRIFGVLVLLTISTVAAWALGSGEGRILAVTIALAIAFTKGTLILMYFMHLKDEPPVYWAILGIGLLAVIILAIGIFPDVAIRVGQP